MRRVCTILGLLAIAGCTPLQTPVAHVATPSFSCQPVRAGSIEALICQDDTLATLDNRLAAIYAEATRSAANQRPQALKADQRGWVKGRDACWQADDKADCVAQEYRHRIAELQARYRLVSSNGPVRFACDGDAGNDVLATFFRTEPPTLLAERGDSASLMFQAPSGSGARYVGRNESLWEHQGEAMVTWGYGAKATRCVRQRTAGATDRPAPPQ